MNRKFSVLLVAFLLALGLSGFSMAKPEPASATSTYYAISPVISGSGWEVGYVRIGGAYAGRQAQVCIQDSYGFTFSCRTFYVYSYDATYSTLNQARTCLASRTWAWLSGVGTSVSPWVDLC